MGMVRKRAREIAEINGRSREQVLQSDMEEAQRELTGVHSHELMEDVPEWERWDPNPGTTGHHTENVETPDEQTVADELVQEGVDEAEHETMVEATEEELRKERRSK